MPGLNRRWIVFLFMFVCALFPETSSSASLEPIKIASTGPGISILPLEIAATKGFFRAERPQCPHDHDASQHRRQRAFDPKRVPLEQVRNWSFTEQARRELASAVTAR